MSNYPTTFHTYILRTAEFALARVDETANLLPDDVRKQALHALSYALGLDDTWPVARDLLLALAPKMEQAGHREDWMPYLAQAIAAGEGQGDWPAVAEVQLQLGILYRMISEFAQAKRWLKASQMNFAKSWDPYNQARVLNELAWVEHLQHHYEAATAHVQQALGLLPADHPECGMSYRVLGMIAIAYEQWKAAEMFHFQALTRFERQGDSRRLAWGLQNLAYALRGQERYQEAIAHYQKAARILKQVGDLYHLSIVQMNLGLAYYHSNEPRVAIQYYLEAEAAPQGLLDKLQFARIKVNLGIALMALGEYKKAEQAFYKASSLYEEIGNMSLCLNAKDGLAMAYLAQYNYDIAESVLQAALIALPEIEHSPNYKYLSKSLNEHLYQARLRQALPVTR